MTKTNAIELSDALLNGYAEEHVIIDSALEMRKMYADCLMLKSALQNLVRRYEDPTDNSNWIDELEAAQITLDCSTRY